MIKKNVLNWLLEEQNPSVRYFTLLSLYEKLPEDLEVIKAKEDIMKKGTVPAILDMQNIDGSWGNPERFYTDKYTGSIWTLLILGELGADSDDERIKRACEFVLKHSQEPESGGFSMSQSKKDGSGLLGGIIPCLTGNMVFALIKLGYLNDHRVSKAVSWIVKYQRTDDGEPWEAKDKFYEKYKVCWGQHSCHMGVAKNFKALAAIPSENRSKEINQKIDQFAEYFLKHHIYKKSHDLMQISRPGWLKPGFPLMYQTDILELLEIFSNLGIKDSRLDDAANIIIGKMDNDGRWKMESSNNGKMLVDIEKKGEKSKWITLKAYNALLKGGYL